MISQAPSISLKEISLLTKEAIDEPWAFTANEVIHAYQTGLKAAADAESRKKMEAFSYTLNQVLRQCNQIIDDLKSIDVVPTRAYVGPLDMHLFKVIIGIPGHKFEGQSGLDAYNILANSEDAIEGSGHQLEIMLAPDYGDINEQQIIFDGYFIKHNNLNQPTA
jgi:hypothetical protein